MATPAGKLASAIAAKDADTATVALPSSRRGGCTHVCWRMQHVRAERRISRRGTHSSGRFGTRHAELIGAGLSLNALCYACCRETSMADKAMEVWALLAEHGVPPEAEPTEKLLLMNLSRHRYDDAFGVFLGAIDAQLQPSAAACTALVRTLRSCRRASRCRDDDDEGRADDGAEQAALLMRACLSCGTVDQCLELRPSSTRETTRRPTTRATAASCSRGPRPPRRGRQRLPTS